MFDTGLITVFYTRYVIIQQQSLTGIVIDFWDLNVYNSVAFEDLNHWKDNSIDNAKQSSEKEAYSYPKIAVHVEIGPYSDHYTRGTEKEQGGRIAYNGYANHGNSTN